jgi:hypothetical protein
MQQRLTEKNQVNYSYGPYNKKDKDQQWIRLTEGCPHNCPYCYEPQEIKVFDVPEIERKVVKIMDMNLLVPSKKPLEILKKLPVRYDGGFIDYEFICGIDYRFLTKEIAQDLKNHHVSRIRIAWDWWYRDQLKVKDALNIIYSVGYKPENIIIFMICNWEIPYEECLRKMDLCKVWNVKIGDCYYDNQIEINEKFIPIGWTTKQALDFRSKVRKHNQLVNFKMDPQLKKKRAVEG